MNAIEMVKALKATLEQEFKNYKFNEEEKKINFFIQNLPRERGRHEQEEYEPYQTIEILNGNQAETENIVNVVIIICVSDDKSEQQGWMDVMNQIDRIRLRFLTNPLFGRKYEVKSLNWMLADDRPYPKCLGGIELKISLPLIEMEGALYD